MASPSADPAEADVSIADLNAGISKHRRPIDEATFVTAALVMPARKRSMDRSEFVSAAPGADWDPED